MYTISVIIPTYNRPPLFEKTLLSLSKIRWPDSFQNIWIIENGPQLGVRGICKNYASVMPVNYIHEPSLGLSFARNAGIKNIESDIIIFFDDDMQFSETTLVEYDCAIQKYGDQFFYGGSLEPDYEIDPPLWLIKYLPWSAKGFDLGDNIKKINRPDFLGGNHAVPRWVFDKIGFYDNCCATGDRGGVGEETRLQEKMLSMGLAGIYIPKAVVYHFIPKDRCSEKWILNRQFRHGLTYGASIDNQILKGWRIFNVPIWFIKKWVKKKLAFLTYTLFLKSKEHKFVFEYESNRIAGIIYYFYKKDNISSIVKKHSNS